ncbi:MAG: histidine kinase [Ginsengibacter sp.]
MQAVFKHLTNTYNTHWTTNDFIQINPFSAAPDFQSIKSRLFEALNSFDSTTNKEALANINAALFYRFLDEQKIDSAIPHGKRAQNYYDDLDKREEAFRIMLDRIETYDNIDNKEALKKEELHAIDYLTNTSDKRTKGYLYEQMGFTYDRIRRFASLVQCFLKSNEIWEELNDKKGQINACHQLGKYYGQLKEIENVQNYFLKELSIREEIKDNFEINETYSAIAYNSIALGKLDVAEKYVMLAKVSFEDNRDPFQSARLLDAEGQLLKAKKMYPEAISKFKQSADLFSKPELAVYLSYEFYYLGQCYQSLGNLPEGLRYASHSFELAVKENWAENKINASLLLSELYAGLHNMPKAYEYLKVHKVVKDEWDLKGERNQAADYETQVLLNQHQRKIDLLERNNILSESQSRQENQQKQFAFAGIGCILFVSAYGFIRFKKRKQLENQQVMLSERLRISRELHDDMGSTLGSISIYSEVAKNRAEKNENSTEALSKIGIASRELIDKMSDIVWSLNPNNESFQQLQNRMQTFAAMILTPRGIHFHLDVEEETNKLKLTTEERKNIYLIYKEAIHNIVKYSECSRVVIRLNKEDGTFAMTVSDDGKGFRLNDTPVYNGNGIKNMQARAADINASLDIHPILGEGTMIALKLKI